MATSIFDKKDYKPSDYDVEQTLKTSLKMWNHLFDYLEHNYGTLSKEWKYYSKNAGWSLKVSNEKGQNIIYFVPNENYFLVGINIPLKLKEQILKANLSKKSKDSIEGTEVCCNGISVLFIINDKNDLEDIKTILSVRDNY